MGGLEQTFFLYRKAHQQVFSYHLQTSPAPYHHLDRHDVTYKTRQVWLRHPAVVI